MYVLKNAQDKRNIQQFSLKLTLLLLAMTGDNFYIQSYQNLKLFLCGKFLLKISLYQCMAEIVFQKGLWIEIEKFH